ncbi:hypothetical protein EDF88_5005 [Buttiauxella sp. BIGb0552]|uniref:hypothetical protein n=1 Tax=Buttiauxella sp. BIGb0552 TaxID=2485120 RepID=UPI0010667125|nr:hypothetical protein [Buttiauxella sp. BIGb0552]TDX09590.1 hypothetical protein EDF88_5005 [Buttiauxella sp. BIGb0552]
MLFKPQYIWIATPVLMRGKQIVVHSVKELEALGFDRSHAVKCAKGKRFMHNNHIMKKVPRTISRKQLEKACGEEVLRALELGLRPDTRCRFKAPIAARNLESGEVVIFHTTIELAAAGFNRNNVNAVINGIRESHRNHVFYRVAADVWNSEDFSGE